MESCDHLELMMVPLGLAPTMTLLVREPSAPVARVKRCKCAGQRVIGGSGATGPVPLFECGSAIMNFPVICGILSALTHSKVEAVLAHVILQGVAHVILQREGLSPLAVVLVALWITLRSQRARSDPSGHGVAEGRGVRSGWPGRVAGLLTRPARCRCRAQAVVACILRAARARSMSTATVAAARAAAAAIRVICQPGMPPVSMTWTVVCVPAGPPSLGRGQIDAPQEHGVHVQEVACQDARGLGDQKLLPGR